MTRIAKQVGSPLYRVHPVEIISKGMHKPKHANADTPTNEKKLKTKLVDNEKYKVPSGSYHRLDLEA